MASPKKPTAKKPTAKKPTAKKGTAKKTSVKKTAASKVKAKKTAVKKKAVPAKKTVNTPVITKGSKLGCEVCGFAFTVDNISGSVEEAYFICCETPMNLKGSAAKQK